MMEALSLKQHVNFGTQNYGNTLGLITMEIISNIRINKVTPGEFLSDHRWVECEWYLRGLNTIFYKNT